MRSAEIGKTNFFTRSRYRFPPASFGLAIDSVGLTVQYQAHAIHRELGKAHGDHHRAKRQGDHTPAWTDVGQSSRSPDGKRDA